MVNSPPISAPAASPIGPGSTVAISRRACARPALADPMSLSASRPYRTQLRGGIRGRHCRWGGWDSNPRSTDYEKHASVHHKR